MQVHSTENNHKFSFRNTLRSVYKAQMLDQTHATVPLAISYSNEKIKKYETKCVKYLHITQCIFVCFSEWQEALQTLSENLFSSGSCQNWYLSRGIGYLPPLPSLRLRALPSLPDLMRCRTVEKVWKEQNKKTPFSNIY